MVQIIPTQYKQGVENPLRDVYIPHGSDNTRFIGYCPKQ